MRLASVLLLLAPLAACVRLGSITRRAPHPLASAATALATPVAAAGLDPDAAFEAAVRHCEDCVRAPADTPLSAEVPRLLRAAFDADFERLLARGGRAVTNVTCMQPVEAFEGSQQLFDDELLAVPLREGRVCRGGVCCDACSRAVQPELATRAEVDAFVALLDEVMEPAEEHPHHNLYLASCAAAGDVRASLLFVRLIERMRRAIAHEYGLRLASIAPRTTFVSRITGAADDASRQSVHADEASWDTFHYSSVLYLSAQRDDFDGGSFAFSDPDPAAPGGRALSPLSPSRGLAVFFSSGWENMHQVAPVLSGTRFAVPAFFVTKAADTDAAAADDDDDAATADALWRSLLRPESEADFKQIFARWHALLARGCEV